MNSRTLYELMRSHGKNAICSVRFKEDIAVLIWEFSDRCYFAELQMGQMTFANKVCQKVFRDIKAIINLYEGVNNEYYNA